MRIEIEGLTNRQIAEIGHTIGQAGYQADDFATENRPTSPGVGGPVEVPAIVHRSGAWFTFGRHYRGHGYSRTFVDEGHHVAFAPGRLSPTESRGPLEWVEVTAAFFEWLDNIRAEGASLDFATAVARGAAHRNQAPSAADETPFTSREQSEVAAQLDRIEKELAAAASQRGQDMEFIRAEFSGLREELARMRRGRWKSMLVGVGLKLAMRGVVSPEAAQQAIRTVIETVGDVTHRLLP